MNKNAGPAGQRPACARRRAARALLLCLATSLLIACSPARLPSVRPIAHLGLLAPFEGQHRRSGYAALDAVRAVTADASAAPAGWIPLALDTSLDAARAARKMMAAPQVAAIVGPLQPADGFALARTRDARPWLAPYAVTDMGFADPAGVDWAEALVRAVAGAAAELGATRLAVAGWDSDWPPLNEIGREGFARIPAINVASPDALDSGDALLWLGNAEDGARFLVQLRALSPDAPVWMGPWIAADNVLFEHARAAGAANIDRVYSIAWLDAGYSGWAESHPATSFYSYLVESAARAALAQSESAGSAKVQSRQPFRFAAVIFDTGVEWRQMP